MVYVYKYTKEIPIRKKKLRDTTHMDEKSEKS